MNSNQMSNNKVEGGGQANNAADHARLSKVEKLLTVKYYKNWTNEDACLWLEEALRLP